MTSEKIKKYAVNNDVTLKEAEKTLKRLSFRDQLQSSTVNNGDLVDLIIEILDYEFGGYK